MRHVLVDNARRRKRKKRGGDQKRVHLELESIGSELGDDRLMELDAALDELAELDPIKSRLVVLRYFGGMTIEQACEVLKISRTTAHRNWTFARAWLFRRIGDTGMDEGRNTVLRVWGTIAVVFRLADLTPDGVVKVLDFGLARPAATIFHAGKDTGREFSGESESEPGMIVGTTSYMSPEQARGQELDGRSDVFSTGILFFQLLADGHPFRGGTASDVMAAILEKAPLSLAECGVSFPGPVVQGIHRCLVKDREHRATSGQFLEGLRQCRESSVSNSRPAWVDTVSPVVCRIRLCAPVQRRFEV